MPIGLPSHMAVDEIKITVLECMLQWAPENTRQGTAEWLPVVEIQDIWARKECMPMLASGVIAVWHAKGSNDRLQQFALQRAEQSRTWVRQALNQRFK